jgi:uncharacterized membrane protein YphA (DoxX/SURF4 family)
MSLPTLIARGVLIATFVVAAIGKLRDPAGTKSGTLDLGVSPRVAALVARVLAPLELLICVLLIWQAKLGGIFAAALVLVFTVAIVLTLRRGKTPVCHCFGQRSSQPIGTDTIVRNTMLFILAVVVATQS